MKNLIKVIFVLFVGSQIVACEVEPETVCSSYFGAVVTCDSGGNLEACANSTDAWYQIGGDYICSYQYNPTTCVNTAVATCGYNSKSSPSEIQLATELLKSMGENVILQQGINQSYIDLGNEVQQDNQ
ncbi:MAG: hypothetical protein QG652_1663 [Pseudomonadota bacterium]|nr:hypothetical protein [Pseudomonadota bacterium]